MSKLASGLLGAVLLAGLIVPAASPAATNFGANLTSTSPDGSNYNCSHPCTIWNTQLPGALSDPTLASPITGVVISYKIITTGIVGATTLHLRVVNALPMSMWRGLGASSPEVLPTTSSAQTFPARVPITVGDFVALESNAPLPKFTVSYTPATASATGRVADSDNTFAPLPADGTPVTPEEFANKAMALEATVEPDADGDAFGDESQDNCLGAAGPNGGCPLPVTATPAVTPATPATPVAKKKCKKKKRAAAAKKKCKKKK